MNPNSIWSVLEECFDLLGGYGYPAMDQAAAELTLEPGWFAWVAAVSLFAAEPFTTAQFMRMFPYGLARLNDERFAFAARQGYLTVNGQGRFCATESGLEVARQIFGAADQSVSHLQPMPDRPFQSLVNALSRLAEASFSAPEPPAHYLLAHKRNMRQIKVTALTNHFERYVSELAGYRDDAYTSAWQAQQIEGHAWETFDQLHHGGALTLDELYTTLKRRGVPQEVYAHDVQELIRARVD